jgi:hypothetical protein
MIDALVINQPIGIVHPHPLRGKMKLGTEGFLIISGVGFGDSHRFLLRFVVFTRAKSD